MKKINISILGLMLLWYFSLANSQVPSVVRVEIDWMSGGTPYHSHKPTQAEINAVIQMFACQGITLTVVLSDSIGHINVLKRDPSNCSASLFSYSGANSYGAIKSANFDNSGGGWHYCLFAHQYEDQTCTASGSSGLANGSADFIVTLGSFSGQIGTPWDRAATFAHELGHNLGLSHVGSMDEDVTGPYIINLPSIMSYTYQLGGVKSRLECMGIVPSGLTLFKEMDYSHGYACTLNENALDEEFGMGISKIDWDCDGTVEAANVAQDISNARNTTKSNNFWCNLTGTRSTLTDYDEWSNIRDITASAELAKKYPEVEYSCITAEEAEALTVLFFSTCVQPSVTNESCVNDNMLYVKSGAGGSHTGTCTNPFSTLGSAQTNAGSGDYLYLAPGNYNEIITLNKRLLIVGPGGIVIGQ
ncbi:MAG: hypothetical protein HY707_01575 [Ignavibacteriae bacterium]|nr:hypothetical protein [Ignavibacteriota bacterium]